jgi:lipopolysaccharide export system protein LptA
VRFTIERLRTLVLVLGALVVVALVAFLAIGRWRSHFNLREIPKRLGVNIQQEANGVTYTQAHGGHNLFKIHASKVVQLKKDGRALLHDVQIELYGEDGARVDRITGDEFEYDQKNGTATAAGPVEITLMRPGVAPAVAPKATAGQVLGNKGKVLPPGARRASEGEVHVKTSGLTFDQKSGVASTTQRVEFAITQGTGSSVGANFDSDKGMLVLDHAVELNILRGTERVVMHAQHAEFERLDLLCSLRGATASFRGGEAAAGEAKLEFRPDGTAVRLDATNGFSLTTETEAHLAAPRASLEFDEQNHPRHGRLEGGVTLDSSRDGRQVHGASPAAVLEFTARGELRHAHLERGVAMHSEESIAARDGSGDATRVSRDWRSPVADVEFREQRRGGHRQVELASVRGTGGVVITGESQHGKGPVLPSKMIADEVAAEFGEGQALAGLSGHGHARLEQTTAAGAKQTTSGDSIEASFVSGSQKAGKSAAKSRADGSGVQGKAGEQSAAAQIQSATVDGNVVLVQEPDSKPGVQAPTLRATAGRAVYEGAGEWLHLTINPRVEDGALQLTTDRLDVSQATGDAFANGNVKATWNEAEAKAGVQGKGSAGGAGQGSMALGGQGPAHVIAAEAQLHQATGEATFRGKARLWQEANSITAPVIVLDRNHQTLTARGTSKSEPVSLTLLSAGNHGAGKGANKPNGTKGTTQASSVIRIKGSELKYSGAERKGIMHGGPAGSVVAETGVAASVSDQLELELLPPGNHAGKDGGSAQVDRMTASGHVSVSSQGRRGTGERLEYSSESGEYVLTGTVAAPPKMTDPVRGTVSGESLIFNSRDDSVSIEGNGRKTTTETTAPK